MGKDFVLVAVPIGLANSVASLIAGYNNGSMASSQVEATLDWSEAQIRSVFLDSPKNTQAILKFLASKDQPTTAAELNTHLQCKSKYEVAGSLGALGKRCAGESYGMRSSIVRSIWNYQARQREYSLPDYIAKVISSM